MRHEPEILVAHVLVDVYQDQHAWEKETEDDVRPVRYRVCGIDVGVEKNKNEQHEPWEEKREQEEVEIDFHSVGL